MKRLVLILIAVAVLTSVFCLSVCADESHELVSEMNEAEETTGGISKTAWTVISVLFVLLVAYAAYSVKFKKK
jgi:H+/Cl- antiporter ClcA